MKELFFSILLLITNLTIGQNTDYFGNNPVWQFSESGYWGNDSYGRGIQSVYTIEGTDTINGLGYHKVLLNEEKVTNVNGSYYEYDNFYDSLVILVRQEGKTIRFYHEETDTDSLYANYDLEIGDSMSGYWFEIHGHPNGVIDEIDSILVGTQYHKMFYTDSSPSATIEGLLNVGSGCISGAKRNLFIMNFPSDYTCSVIDLMCYGHNYNLEFDNNFSGEPCQLTMELKTEIENPLILYPNPAKDFLLIKGAKTNIEQFQIHDLNGRVLAKDKFYNQIDVSSLKSGIYVIVLIEKNEEIYRERFVKQ